MRGRRSRNRSPLPNGPQIAKKTRVRTGLQLRHRRVIKFPAAFKCFRIEWLSSTAVKAALVRNASFDEGPAELSVVTADKSCDQANLAAEYFRFDM